MNIRRVEETDFEKGLVDAYIYGYRFHYNGRPDIFSDRTDEELKEEIVRRVLTDNILVIEDDDKIIGFVIYEIRDKHAKTMWVDQLIINENYHKKGYGRRLMDKIYEIAKAESCSRVEFECWAFNENAIDMYKHLGYTEQRVKFDMKVR